MPLYRHVIISVMFKPGVSQSEASDHWGFPTRGARGNAGKQGSCKSYLGVSKNHTEYEPKIIGSPI